VQPQPAQPGPFSIKLDPEEVGEPVIGGFNSVADQINRLNSQLGEILAYQQQQAEMEHQNRMAEFDARFDDTIGKLDTFSAIVGKGSIVNLAPDSAEKANRLRAYETFIALVAGYESAGLPMPDERVLIQEAAYAVFGDTIHKQARAKIADRLKDAKGKFTARPTHTSAQTAIPDQTIDDEYYAESREILRRAGVIR